MDNEPQLAPARCLLKDNAAKDFGFSLIEVVVVTSIVATLSLTAVLGLRMAPEGTPSLRMDAFARGLRYLQAEALFAGRSFGVAFAEEGWEVMVFSEADRAWVRRDPAALHGAGDWGVGNRLAVQIEGLDIAVRAALPEDPTPDVFLLPSGETTPFGVRLDDGDGRRAACTMQSYGELQCNRGG